MSVFYKESNFEDTKELYGKSVIYKSEIMSYAEKYSNVVDFNFAEKYLYGRVDRNYVSIQPNEILNTFSRIRNSPNNTNVVVLNFVAEAFQELSRQFVKAAQIGKIRKEDDYLSNLIAYQGYTSPDVLYSTYITSFIESVKIKIKNDGVNFYNFEQFVFYLENYAKSVSKVYPFTRTAFVKSRHNDYLSSGLTIEIADLSFANDSQKIDLFVNSPNFEYYLNACNSFGFMVDAASPWKITLDIGHEDVIENLLRPKGYNSLNSLLSVGYKKSYFSYFNDFNKQLLNIYNQVTNNFTVTKACSTGIKTQIIKPVRYTNEQFNNIYNEDYFIKLYCMFRFIEEEKKHSQAEQDHIITDTINLSRTTDLRTALGRFERFISQPFDYRGSLSYLIREQEKREDR